MKYLKKTGGILPVFELLCEKKTEWHWIKSSLQTPKMTGIVNAVPVSNRARNCFFRGTCMTGIQTYKIQAIPRRVPPRHKKKKVWRMSYG